jgi:hypothetical protein
MNHSVPNHYDRESGFTLIELLIMLVLLTPTLAAVVILALGGINPKTENTVLQKDYAIIGVRKVADAAAVLGEAAGNASLAPALILDRNQLTHSTPASSIRYAGKSSTNEYFNVVIRPHKYYLPYMHTCLVAPDTSLTATIKIGLCKVPS